MNSTKASGPPKATDHEPHVQAVALSVTQPAGIAMPQLVTKRWGHELIFINESYCMKELLINEGHSTSMHFHVLKHETLLVTQGVLTLRYKDGKGGDHSMDIPAGTAFVVPQGFQHKLCARQGVVKLVEASTYDQTEDSVRVHL